MKIYFLGTGTSQGIPVLGSHHPVCKSTNPKDKRLRVSVLIEWEGLSVLIDCGPDFRQQMLNANCQSLSAILFTHEHADHTAGLDDIRPYNFLQKMPIPIYLEANVLDSLQQRFAYIFAEENRYPGAPEVQTNIIVPFQKFNIQNKTILPIRAMHGNLPVLGFRLENFVYLTDVKSMEDTDLHNLKDVSVLVINALRLEPHPTHFNLEEALAFIEKVKPQQTYLTHISHHLGFHDEVQAQLPNNVYLAYDNLEISL